jgi:uncharacterized protein
MAGITDLNVLLASMEPELLPDEFVFCTIPASASLPQGTEVVGMFLENEGRTLIVRASDAHSIHGKHSNPMRCISLTVHSSLDAVGLTAAFSAELAKHDISANIVAAFYHDHIFVGAADAERAVEALRDLSRRSAPG